MIEIIKKKYILLITVIISMVAARYYTNERKGQGQGYFTFECVDRSLGDQRPSRDTGLGRGKGCTSPASYRRLKEISLRAAGKANDNNNDSKIRKTISTIIVTIMNYGDGENNKGRRRMIDLMNKK